MNTELFIAKRLNSADNKQKKISTAIINITIVGIALGLAVMIIATAIVTGFKKEIKDKIVGFGSHIQITNFDSNKSFETIPIKNDSALVKSLKQIPQIKNIQSYVTKAGIIKTKENFHTVILKGVDNSFDTTFFHNNLTQGHIFTLDSKKKSNQILISEYIASLLKLKVGSKVTTYFLQEPPRIRSFTVCGIYKTSIQDFDKAFVVVDLRHLQKLNSWKSDQISGYEIIINDFEQLVPTTQAVFDKIGYNYEKETQLNVTHIKQRYQQIFDWINVQDVNVWIILTLMVIVASFNMISSLLIIILERTNTIGLLKAVGYNNWNIRKIFIYQSTFLTIKGLFWGNIIGISLCLLQKHFSLIPLDETAYYISTVPINLKLIHLALLNLGTLIVIFTMMIVPSALITKIKPAKAIKMN